MTEIYSTSDQKQRELAVDPTKSFIVEAPAGSGKTSVLIQRYLALLAKAVNSPEEILAITFTRKAANEMRLRIIEALHAAQHDAPLDPHKLKVWQLAQAALRQDKKHNWQILRNPNRLRISTIDGFCSRVVLKNPFLAGLGTAFNIVNDNGSDECYKLAARKLLYDEGLEDEYREALTRLLLHIDNNWREAENLLAQILSTRDQWLPYLVIYPNPSELRRVLERGLKNILLENIYNCKKLLTSELIAEILMVTHLANPGISLDDEESLWRASVKLLVTEKYTWREKIVNKSVDKKRLQDLIANLKSFDELPEYLKAIALSPPVTYDDDNWQVLLGLIELLKILAVFYLPQVFRKQGVFDHVEVALAFYKTLGFADQPSDLALALDYKIQHLLVDEFQDTSIFQYRILEKLTAGWQEGDGKTIFVVGDPMQSIYKFRDARVGLFLRTKRYGINNLFLQTLTLSSNFRATNYLVNWCNDTFAKVFPREEHIGLGAVKFIPAQAFSSENSNAVKIYKFAVNDQVAEAAQIISIIKQQQSSDATITVLVRSRSHLEELVKSLKNSQLPYIAAELESLSESILVKDLLSLTRALLDQGDQLSWLAMLRSPFCGLTLHDLHVLASFDKNLTLWEVMKNYQHLPELSNDGKQRLALLVRVLQKALAEKRRSSLRSWVEGVWLTLKGPLTVSDENEFTYGKIYFDLLAELEDANTIDDLDMLEERVNNIRINYHTGMDGNCVQLMTIHKAKGLEFDIVILPGLDRGVKNNEHALLMLSDRPCAFANEESDLILAPIIKKGTKEDPVYNYLRYEDRKKQHYENHRLLYVAATRARKKLYLLACFDADKPKGDSLLAELWMHFEREPITQLAELQQEKITIATDNSLTRLTIENFPAGELIPILSNQALMPAVISYDDEVPQKLGVIVHETLNYLGKVDALRWFHDDFSSYDRVWLRKFKQVGIYDNLDEHLAFVKNAITNTLNDSRGKWILSQHHQDIHSEYELSFEDGSEIKQIILDRAFIADGVRWIVDFKTAVPVRSESLDNFLNRQKALYLPQLSQYFLAMKNLDPTTPIKTGLYFPLISAWLEVEVC